MTSNCIRIFCGYFVVVRFRLFLTTATIAHAFWKAMKFDSPFWSINCNVKILLHKKPHTFFFGFSVLFGPVILKLINFYSLLFGIIIYCCCYYLLWLSSSSSSLLLRLLCEVHVANRYKTFGSWFFKKSCVKIESQRIMFV